MGYYGAKQGLTACKDWYDDYIECVHKSKQNLRVKAMHKKRHVDNHIEYLQGKRTYAETYEAPPKAHASWNHGMTPSSPTCRRRSTRIFFGSHLETNHSLYSVATNVLNLSDLFSHFEPLAKLSA